MRDDLAIGEVVDLMADAIAVSLDFVTVAIVAIGAVAALVGLVRGAAAKTGSVWKRNVWRRFAGWIALALEFALAADICRTAIAPSWDDIGRLGAIAAIRTALNYFLERDLAEMEPRASADQA